MFGLGKRIKGVNRPRSRLMNHYQKGKSGVNNSDMENKSYTFSEQVHMLLRSDPALKFIFLIKFIESFAYFSNSQVITLYLTDDYGISDVNAGLMYGVYGAGISIYGILLSAHIDALGVRKGLMLGFLLSAIGRTALAICYNIWVVYIVVFLLLPIAGALGIPILLIGMKQSTTPKNKSFAFGMFYTFMNIGALACGPIIDLSTWFSPANANRLVFAFSGLASILAGVITVLFIEDKSSKVDEQTEGGGAKKESVRSLLTTPSFIKFMIFSMLMTNVRSMFRHLDATLPKYLIRQHGPGVAKGLIYSINPISIIIFVPLFQALTSHRNAYDIIVLGSFISALSPLALVVLGNLLGAGCFVFMLSLGEALWSPRFLDYQVSVSPEGREAVFMAFASAPYFLSKLPAGYFSGYLLERYCPDPSKINCDIKCYDWINEFKCGNDNVQAVCDKSCGFCDENSAACFDTLCQFCNSSILWFIIMIVSLMSPVLMVIFKRRIAIDEGAQPQVV